MTNKENFNLDRTFKWYIIIALTLAGIYLFKNVASLLIFSALLSLALTPLVERLQKIGLGSFFSVFLPILLLVVLGLGIGAVMISQLADLSTQYGDFEQEIIKKLNQLSNKLPTSIVPEKFEYISDLETLMPDDPEVKSSFFTSAFSSTSAIITGAVLIPVISFFTLFYRNKFKGLIKWADDFSDQDFVKIGKESKSMIQQYLSGMALVVFIIATLATLGLWIIGIKFALLLGVMSALLTVVPYVGTFVGALIPIMVAFVTKDSFTYPLVVAGMYIVIQTLENNVISPFILGNSVNLNPLTCIVALLVFGPFMGLIGLVVAVPVTAIIMIILKHSKRHKALANVLNY
mgnify:CR=1 FL=1